MIKDLPLIRNHLESDLSNAPSQNQGPGPILRRCIAWKGPGPDPGPPSV